MGQQAEEDWIFPRPGSHIHIPRYALYGERVWQHDLDGLHIEPLGLRSAGGAPIDPHRHPELYQFTWIRSGGGLLDLDGTKHELDRPHLVMFPPMVTHGFRWDEEPGGHVLMATALLLREIVPTEDAKLLEAPIVLAPDAMLADEIDHAFERLAAELDRNGAGRRSGLASLMLWIISLMARDMDSRRLEAALVSPEAGLVDRFRELIESHFWDHLGLEDYCARLGVTSSRLSRACRIAAGKSPLTLIQDRLLLAAKRKLTYTAVSVSEVAFELGFKDPAYFSRFFSRHVGISPLEFRTRGRWSS